MDLIQSRDNPIFKQALKLAGSRRERLKARATLLSGLHLVEAALEAGWSLHHLLHREGSPPTALNHAPGARSSRLAADLFDTLEQMPSPTPVLAIASVPEPPSLRRDGWCLLLDGVQDPGNVGTLLRTAAAAGVDQAWLGTGCADAWSPKVLRAAMGAHFALPVVERVDPVAAALGFQGTRAITALDGATDLFDCRLDGDLLLVLGAEGQGVSAAVAATASLRIRIPMRAGVESLNVGAAGAVCLFEASRQRRGTAVRA